MAHFYFDLHECGHGAVIDEEGLDLPDLAAAREQAIRSARDVMKGELDSGHLCLGCAIVIRDERGDDVMAVPFADALSVTFAGTC